MPVSLHSFLIASSLAPLAVGFASAEDATSSQLRLELEQITVEQETLPRWISSEQQHGRLGFHGFPSKFNWIILDLGETVRPEEIVLFPARSPADSADQPLSGFPPEIEVELSQDTSFENAVRIARWQEALPDEGMTLPMIRLPIAADDQAPGRYLRLRIFGDRQRSSEQVRFFSLGEIVVLEKGINVALQTKTETSRDIDNAPRWQAENLTDGFLWCLPGQGPEVSPQNGFHSGIESTYRSNKWVEVDLGNSLPVDEVHLIPAHPRDFADTVGFGFPPQFKVLGLSGNGQERVLFASGTDGYPNPGAATVMLPAGAEPIQHIRVECPELWQRTGDYLFALGELQAWSDGENVALGKPVHALDQVESASWDKTALTDGYSSRRNLLSWKDWLDGLSRREQLKKRSGEIAAILAERSIQTRRRWVMGGVIVTMVLLGGLCIGLVWQKRQAARSREALRLRIAHDLHDELGAGLSHLALQSDLARRQLPEGEPLRDRLVDLSADARNTLDNMRDVIWLLAPATDSWHGFRDRVESITERLLEGIEHRFVVDGEFPAGSPPIEWTREWVLFFKETLTNARRHADAEEIIVRLTWQPRLLSLQVQDNGKGFDTESPVLADGLGMKSLYRRAAALGGNIEIESQPGTGTLIRMEAPF